MLGDQHTVIVSREPVVGWRGWKLDDDVLISPTIATRWETGQLVWDQVCRCKQEAACHCGINAFATRTQLARSIVAGELRCVDVVGSVAMSGAVRAYERGYRAEVAQVTGLHATRWRHGRVTRRAAKRIGVPYCGVLRKGHVRLRLRLATSEFALLMAVMLACACVLAAVPLLMCIELLRPDNAEQFAIPGWTDPD